MEKHTSIMIRITDDLPEIRQLVESDQMEGDNPLVETPAQAIQRIHSRREFVGQEAKGYQPRAHEAIPEKFVEERAMKAAQLALKQAAHHVEK